MAKRLNPNMAKIHRSYTVEEVAGLFLVHKNTVRTWVKNEGLPVCDNQKPLLILGGDLRKFIKDRNNKRKRKCKPYEMYCVGCKLPRKPAENMVDYEPDTDTKGRLTGLCPFCGCIINKFISLAAYADIQQYFTDGT